MNDILLINPRFAARHAMAMAEAKRVAETHGGKGQSLDDISDWYRSRYRSRQRVAISAAGIAYIHVYGFLGSKFDPIYNAVGLVTDYEILKHEFDSVLNNPQVQDIVFDIESGGGYAQGAPSLAGHILANRGKKPIHTYSDSMICSAAFYIGCSADTVITSVDAAAGSIGTRMTMFDYTKMMEQAGYTAHEFQATGADLKATGSPYHVPTDAEKEFIQQGIDQCNERFQNHVLAARPDIDLEVFRAGHYEGEHAVDLGLVDLLIDRSDLEETIIAMR